MVLLLLEYELGTIPDSRSGSEPMVGSRARTVVIPSPHHPPIDYFPSAVTCMPPNIFELLKRFV
jgi:hypothetical protein